MKSPHINSSLFLASVFVNESSGCPGDLAALERGSLDSRLLNATLPTTYGRILTDFRNAPQEASNQMLQAEVLTRSENRRGLHTESQNNWYKIEILKKEQSGETKCLKGLRRTSALYPVKPGLKSTLPHPRRHRFHQSSRPLRSPAYFREQECFQISMQGKNHMWRHLLDK